MKFCTTHWERLRQQIKSHGIFDLVAASGEEVLSQAVDSLKGVKETLERYDPLMAAHNMITGRAIEAGGVYILMQNPDDAEGHYCPLCELAKHTSPEIAEEWIVGASKAAADHAVELRNSESIPKPDSQ